MTKVLRSGDLKDVGLGRGGGGWVCARMPALSCSLVIAYGSR